MSEKELEKKINPEYDVLIQNLIDVVQEEQIKIGYRKEVVRLYYPAKSVNK